MARVITKNIDVEGRKFVVRKYTAIDGLKVVKTLTAKILPVFQSFMPLVNEAQKGSVNADHILSNLGSYLSMDTISQTLDKVAPGDLDFIMQKSLMCVFEVLPAGDMAIGGVNGTPVLNADGTYGVVDVEYDPLLVLRLVCEAVLWGIGDFFDGKRLISIMSPLSSTLQRNQ